ncbi:Uncharacterized protein PCOAH_00010730 [Plasmodium coatneyi]|uniref:Thrombospondin-related protein 1 n=1 Tax=Plasmodium coatneyi TaxID=208452 RepID=A0A1B1DV92_9APIC|nr:Uncharacterized protein PCOAH_00010730 [Plasmodium coatneyi]ANQ06716.1 Uncharacterized protein PCOAH_00010730 [Plasmodium coatneyi]
MNNRQLLLSTLLLPLLVASVRTNWGARLKGRSLQEGDDAKDAPHGGKNTNQYFKCFVDKAKENTAVREDDVARWVDPQHNSCYCSEENTQPCSMNDISNSKFISQLMKTEICDLNDRGSKNNLFIVLENYSTMKCSNVDSTTEKINQSELYNYCKSGLPAWDNKHFYEYLNCDTVRNKQGKQPDGIGPDGIVPGHTCADLCKEIKELCNSKSSQFYSFEMCSKYYEINHFTADIFNKTFKTFQDNCSYFDPTNRGLLLCKHKHIPCEFSEWSDWTTCTKSCKNGSYDAEAIRSRKRYLVKEVKYAGKACSIVVKDKNKLVDVDFCGEVPLCSSINPSSNASNNRNGPVDTTTPEKTYDNPPFVIPLKEIEKANMLNDLNQPDGDVINENFVHNEMDTLTECTVADMGLFEHSREYSEKIKSCACPPYHSPCYFKDIYKSDYWKKSFDRHCADNPTLNVVTADFVMLSCDNSITIRKKEIAVNTYLAMTFDCRSPTFRYLFCSKSNESSRTNIFYIVLTCALALISSLYLIHLLLSEHDKWAFFITRIVNPKRASPTDHPSTGHSSGSSSDEMNDNGEETPNPEDTPTVTPLRKYGSRS